jgi:hypothetical protein
MLAISDRAASLKEVFPSLANPVVVQLHDCVENKQVPYENSRGYLQ